MASRSLTLVQGDLATPSALRSPSLTRDGRHSRRVRVLHVIQNLNYGGMERLLADIVRGMDPARFEGHVLALQYLGRFAKGLDEVAQLHLADPMSRWSMLRPASLARQFERISPDVVHTHSGVWYKASLAARMAGVTRVIHTEHGRRKPDPLADRIVDAMAARRTDVVVAVSDRLGEQLVATHISSASRVRVVPNGVDTAAYRPRADDGAVRAELGIAPNTPVVGSIGRLEPIKGYDVMVDAFAHLLSSWPDARKPVLVVGGEGTQRTKLETLVDARGIRPYVRLLGWRNDTHALHAMFSVFTMSSRSEGTSVSLLEAMSAGLCPIVTDVGGNRAVLGQQLAHRLVHSEDAPGLAAALRNALRQPGHAAADGVIARERVQTHFGLGAMIRAYEQLYDAVPVRSDTRS